ncbi:hypothetical protein NW762_009798 [Fusarium torreyae]|uniref:Uncharacterized protein n=1 Tax=Fusarium torreyae TaxID=1237075 RepID=A0A9W8RUG9_9HYPO|nr:hypothetical protein NW762_009798 [Fusarium torreyae]
MSNIATTTADGSTSFVFLPDSHTALASFNNDLTLSTLLSDESYITDDANEEEDDENDDATIPSSYLTTFPVETPRLSSVRKDDSRVSPSTYRNSPSVNEIYNTYPFDNTPFQPSTPTIRCSSMESGSSNSISEQRQGFSSNVPYGRPSNTPKPEMRRSSVYEILVNEPHSYFWGCYAHQLNRNCPVNTFEPAKRGEQDDCEMKTLGWGTSQPSSLSHTTGREKDKIEWMEWPGMRQKHIDNEPTNQQRASDLQLLSDIARIREKHKKFIEKGVK